MSRSVELSRIVFLKSRSVVIMSESVALSKSVVQSRSVVISRTSYCLEVSL